MCKGKAVAAATAVKGLHTTLVGGVSQGAWTSVQDPSRAHEYLALASLLVRLLEIATVNPKP